MSYIAFSSKEGRVEVGGSERARMGVLIDDLAWVMHRRGNHEPNPQKDYSDKLAWVYGDMRSGREDGFAERLGWVCLIGDDVLKLLAHIHGQCELHAWVHPDDGEWFAGLIEEAVKRGLLGDDGRAYYGSWQDVADLARRSTTPLVSAYSVTEGWPDPYLIGQHRPDLFTPADEDDPWESWSDLPDSEKDRISDEAIASVAPRWHSAEWGTHWAEGVSGRTPWAVA